MILLVHIITFLVSLSFIWIGAGVIVNSVEKLARKLKASAFVVSFFVLGLMTSVPETSIGFNALREQEPEIFIGTFLGGSVVMFLLVIPVFGILGNGVKLNNDLGNRKLLLFLAYILLPILLLVDGRASVYDGLILVLYYCIMLVATYKKRSRASHEEALTKHGFNSFKEICLIGAGLVLVLISSNLLVRETEYFAESFKLSELVLSLLVLAVGTNIPELSIAVRSVYKNKRDIAFGNYLGSAVANSLILGVLILLNNGVDLSTDLVSILVALLGGIGLFYIFAKSKDELSRRECLVLLFGYFLFVLYEVAFKI